MGFGAGGGGALPNHEHTNIALDGGPLDFSNTTIASLANGDMTYSNGAALQALSIGGANTVIQSVGGIPSWQTLPLASSVLTTAGDVLMMNNVPELARLGAANNGDVMTLSGGLPSWATPTGGIWTAVTATASSLQSELAVTITGNPDIIQILYNVCGDNSTTSILGVRLNNDSSTTYNSRVMGFYTTFDYDVQASKSAFWVDRGTPSHNRVGECLIFKANANFDVGSADGNVGWCFRNSSSESEAGAAACASYVVMSGGANESITGNVTSLQVLFDSGDILGNIQVNSMTYQ